MLQPFHPLPPSLRHPVSPGLLAQPIQPVWQAVALHSDPLACWRPPTPPPGCYARKSALSRLGATVLLFAIVGGCQYGTEGCVGQRVRGMASCPLDVTPPPASNEIHDTPRPEPSPARFPPHRPIPCRGAMVPRNASRPPRSRRLLIRRPRALPSTCGRRIRGRCGEESGREAANAGYSQRDFREAKRRRSACRR